MVTLEAPRDLEVEKTNVFDRNRACTKRIPVNVGGRGSSKSYSIAQLITTRFASGLPHKIGVTRKTGPALHRTAYALLKQLLVSYGIYPYCHEVRSPIHTITFKQASIDFFALDEESKIHSADYNLLWMEEANEFDWDDWMALNFSLRAPEVPGYPVRLFLSLNPTDGNGWIPTRLLKQADTELIHSTYKDNTFLSPEYVATLKALIDQDENYYRVNTLGEWGRLENLVFTRYDQVDDFPKEVQAWCYGLDFGFSNPTALVKVGLKDGHPYFDERIYQDKLTNADLIERLSHEDRGDIFADSAEPQRIEEICRAGFRCYPAHKDVKYGLDLMKRTPMHITKWSANMLKEVRGYQHKKDKDGRILEEAIKFGDHTIDAGRYGLCGLTERVGLATAVRQSAVVHNFKREA